MAAGIASADPADLDRTAASFVAGADVLTITAHHLGAALDALRASGPEMLAHIPALDLDLAVHARTAAALSDDVAWVARAFRDADTRHGPPLTGPVHTTDTTVAGHLAAAGLTTEIRRTAHLPPAERATAIRDYFDQLSAHAAAWLVTHRPDAVGDLDGVPEQLRYDANRLRIATALADTERLLTRTDFTDQQRRELEQRQRHLADFLSPRVGRDGERPRQFLLFDPAGLGRAAEVIGGTLEGAEHVAVLVPGMTSRLVPYFRSMVRNAEALVAAADQRQGEKLVVIALLNSRAPQTPLEVLSPSWAAAAAPELDVFIRGQRLRDEQTVTVFAHSYGSVVAGYAAGDDDGLPVDNMVVLGSPGMGAHVRTARDLHLNPGGRVYAAGALGDFVSWSGAHGNRPVEADFGAFRLATGDAIRGHSSYFEGESVANFAAVATGHTDAVRTTPHAAEGLLPGIVDDRLRWTEGEARELTDAVAGRMRAAAMAAGDTFIDAAHRLDESVEVLGGLVTDGLSGLSGWRP